MKIDRNSKKKHFPILIGNPMTIQSEIQRIMLLSFHLGVTMIFTLFIKEMKSEKSEILLRNPKSSPEATCIFSIMIMLSNICDPPNENRPCSHLVVIRETGV